MKSSRSGISFLFAAAATLWLLSSSSSQAEVWPQFRGPGGDGIATAENLPLTFGETENLSWKTELEGRGWSSPVFDGKSVWLTSAKEIFPSEEERIAILKANGEEEKKFKQRQVAKAINLSVQQVDFETGKLLKTIALASIKDPDTIHTLNSFASPTPVLAGGKLFAHFGSFGTFCIDTGSGEIDWQKKVVIEHGVGPGSSPVVHEGRLILICDGIDRQFVTALNVANGEEIWTTDRPEMRAKLGDQKKSYNTPLVVRGKDGKDQLVCMGAQWLVSYVPATGEEIWRYDHGSGFSVVPRPVFSEKHQLLYISTGFGKPELLALRIDGSGDITGTDKLVWKETKRIPAKPSPLLVGDEIYVISDGGVASSFNAATGELHWNERIDGNYSASPLFADGHILVANQEGTVTAFAPGKEYSQVASNQLDGSLMASPVAIGESLLIRSDKALYRFEK